jgi:hypothetical protein
VRHLAAFVFTGLNVLLLDRKIALEYAEKQPSPSSILMTTSDLPMLQKTCPIYNGRPFVRLGPPLASYHPILADLHENFNNISERPVDNNFFVATAQLAMVVQAFYKREETMLDAWLEKLGPLLGFRADNSAPKVEIWVDRNLKAEADYIVYGRLGDDTPVPCLILEVKRNLEELDIQNLMFHRANMRYNSSVRKSPSFIAVNH